MSTASVQVELVHDPHRHRAVIGWSADPALLKVTAEQLIHEAERRAAELDGINDLFAAQERAEADRLRKVLAIVMPGEASA